MGPYCRFCDNRCFIRLPENTPAEARKAYGTNTIIATCPRGQAYEMEKVGWNNDRIKAAIKAEQERPAPSLTDDLQAFFASPEFEDAFNRWRAKYTAAAMVDLSPTALEPFAPVAPARWWRVAGWLHSPENLCPMLRINRPEFAKDAQAAADIVQSDYSRNAGYTLVWTNPPQVELDTVLCEALGVDISAPKPLYTQISTPPTYIKDSPLMGIIEQSDTE